MAVCTRYRDQAAMKNPLLLLCITLLSACANTPQPPDWQANAFAALNNYSSAYLEGNTRVADLEFARAKTEVSRTGRPDLMARLELVRCATQVASLVDEPCHGYLAVAADAEAPEQAYAAFISGEWTGLDVKLLPVVYQGVVAQAMQMQVLNISPGSLPPATGSSASIKPAENLQKNHPFNQIRIEDPLSRLIVAGVLLKKELLTPTDIGLAVDSASNQGWRRPLLAWLGVQLKRAQAGSDATQAARLQRRIGLVLQMPLTH